jgi:hypothetical protein
MVDVFNILEKLPWLFSLIILLIHNMIAFFDHPVPVIMILQQFNFTNIVVMFSFEVGHLLWITDFHASLKEKVYIELSGIFVLAY